MKLFPAFTTYGKMHKLHMLYLLWTGQRMKRNLKLVINCDALMIRIVNTEHALNKITEMQLICSPSILVFKQIIGS